MANLFKDLNDLIAAADSFIRTTGDRIIADMNTFIATIEAELKAGTIDAAGAAQQEAGPKDLIVLVKMIEDAIGPIPDNAGPLYLVMMLARKVQNPTAMAEFNTQAKKVLGDFGAIAKLFPGLPL